MIAPFLRRLTVAQKVAEKPKIALLCGSSRFVDIMAVSPYPRPGHSSRRLQTFGQGRRPAALTDARGVQLLLSDDGVREVGDREVGAQEVGAREVGTQEVGMREIGEHEVGVCEVGAIEVGAREVGALEDCAREVGDREVGAPEVGTREVCVPQVGVREAGAREVGAREVETVSSGKKRAVNGFLGPDPVQDRLHIGANLVCGARLLSLLRRGLAVFACAWVRALSGLVRWMPDEGAEDVDHTDHAIGRILDQAPQSVDAAQADRELLAPQVLDRRREEVGDLALLGDAGLLVRDSRLLGRGLCLPSGRLGLVIGRIRAPTADAETDYGGAKKSQVADDLAARRAGAPLLPVGPREDGKVLRHDRGDHHEHDQSRDDETHARQFAPARANVQLSREAA